MNDNNFLQDVIPPKQKRSIRDIPVPPRRRPVILEKKPTKSLKNDHIVQELKPKTPITPPSGFVKKDIPLDEKYLNELNGKNYKKGKKIKTFLITSSIVAILAIVFFIISFLENAVISIEQKTVEASINKSIPIADITKNSNQNVLGYRLIEISKELTKNIPAEKEEFVQSKASGTITIFNEYSDRPQTLIRNTRFESPNGLIYRIQESITVPGYRIVDGNKIPGSIDAVVFADENGEKYNINLVDFTIPGFKGQEQFNSFYAKSKTPMTEGYNGIRKIVDSEVLSRSSQQLISELKSALILEITNQISKEFIAIFDDNSFVFNNVRQTNSADGRSVDISVDGKLSIKVFNKIALSNEIAKNTIIDYRVGQDVLIQDIDSVIFTIKKLEDSTNLLSSETIDVNQNMTFVWQIDIENFKKTMAGKTKNDLGLVLSNFPAITKGSATISPFWKKTFPVDIKNINLQITNNKN
ncbi:MAG TPA: hypothetical protein PJ997_00230 [Candidatus Paceibacterota bacterium]|nr:hypothetical protein [Candidatus Paceibacterota bacterium]HMP18758.1 hypothetical protein [Candidatus Paceibacterota bacterium]HMP85319.1 hypothetical protein [Candidatus Paceibacterota bacterium]